MTDEQLKSLRQLATIHDTRITKEVSVGVIASSYNKRTHEVKQYLIKEKGQLSLERKFLVFSKFKDFFYTCKKVEVSHGND